MQICWKWKHLFFCKEQHLPDLQIFMDKDFRNCNFWLLSLRCQRLIQRSPVFNKCFVLDWLQLFKTVRPEVRLKSEAAMQWKLKVQRNSVTLNQCCWVDLHLNYVCSLSMYLAGKSRERRRDEHWKVISHIPKFHFRVAEVPLFTGLWWRGALIATSCFSPLSFPSPS